MKGLSTLSKIKNLEFQLDFKILHLQSFIWFSWFSWAVWSETQVHCWITLHHFFVHSFVHSFVRPFMPFRIDILYSVCNIITEMFKISSPDRKERSNKLYSDGNTETVDRAVGPTGSPRDQPDARSNDARLSCLGFSPFVSDPRNNMINSGTAYRSFMAVVEWEEL